MPSDLSTTSAQIRYDLKAGRAWVAVFEASTGTAVLEYRTPRGSLRAERPRLVLWRPGAPAHILADLDLATTERSI
ncbi:MAG: hypothetical protein JXB39_00165, partial [Deltaproteobacteria bacterium]|nr:hypothetical protein [Deltaproteobacteria bacterium]